VIKWFSRWWKNRKEALIHEQWLELCMWKCALERQELEAGFWPEAPGENVVPRSSKSKFGLGMAQKTCI